MIPPSITLQIDSDTHDIRLIYSDYDGTNFEELHDYYVLEPLVQALIDSGYELKSATRDGVTFEFITQDSAGYQFLVDQTETPTV